jgi:hypothetical protein
MFSVVACVQDAGLNSFFLGLQRMVFRQRNAGITLLLSMGGDREHQ